MPNMIRRLPKSFVADSLAVRVPDIVRRVPHDSAHGNEVTALVALRLKRMAQTVEVPAPVDFQVVEQLPRLVGQRPVLDAPRATVLRDEQQPGVLLVLRLGSQSEP